MYDELITALRACVDKDKDCSECPYCERCMNNTSGKHAAMVDAADAIEELSRAQEQWIEQERKTLLKSLPRWIPVTERLPEEPYGCLLVVWDSPYGGGDDFLNYLPYFAGYDGEQWNDGDGMQVPFEAEYWMPLPSLPEPPKEEV